MISETLPAFTVRLARSEADIQAAQRLRYDVFVTELGGGGDMVDHAARLERDRFDPFVDHLLLCDEKNGAVVGAYRLLRQAQAEKAGGFYSASEFDLEPLHKSERRLLELGRSCLHPDYRGGTAMHALWGGLARYIAQHQIDVLFGVASFHGTDPNVIAAPLALLKERHLAPPEFRVRSLMPPKNMILPPPDQLDRKAAMRQVPSLIKAYLRLGGWVGEGAFVDHDFNTVDVCLIMDTAQLNPDRARFYEARAHDG